MTLLLALGLALTPAGASYALGLGSVFSNAEVEVSIIEQSQNGVVLDVHGTDYKGRKPGIEIALNPVGYLGSGTRSTFVKSVVHNPEDPEDWSYRFTLDAAQVAQLDSGTNYQIMTMRGGGRDLIDSADSEETRVPLDFDTLSRPASTPTPEQPSDDAGSPEGEGGAGGSGEGTSSGRATGGSGEGSGVGADDEPEAKESKKPWSAPEEPPTAKGLDLTGIDDASVDADAVIHARASGFQPNETDIKVVVYSTPLVLSTSIKANGHGVAKWSGRLPKDIGLGEHTLTFQGSVNRGIRFVVTGTPSDGECVQSGCAPDAGAVKKPAAAETGGVGGGLTWVIVVTMIVLALVGGAVALLSGRRRRDQEWDEPGYAQAPPRYPADPRQASGPYPGAPRPPRQPRDQQPPRRRQPEPQPQPQPQVRREPQPPRRRAAAQQPPVQRQPSRRRPAPQPQPQPQSQPAPAPRAPEQPPRRQPRPPESFAPPGERPQAYAGQRVAGR